MITTIVDAVSLMVYFNLACHLLDMGGIKEKNGGSP